MKQSRLKKHKSKELDLLPVMNLFSILVTVTMSMATFEKLGILELWLPERSQVPSGGPPDIEEGLLNLTVVITDKGITIGAAGGFQPTTFYQEEVEYRSRSDQHVFRKIWKPGEEVRSPTDGKVMTPFEKETIFLNTIAKKDSADPGVYVYAAVNHEGEPMMDDSSRWYSDIPRAGSPYRLVGDDAFRKMDEITRHYSKRVKLSAYHEVARTLEQIHKAYSQRDPQPPDVDDIVILADEDVIYDKVIQMMDACKAAGYDRVALSLISGEA
jgi:biopolymer transport protein ExbD